MKLGINTYTYMWSIGFAGAQPPVPMTFFDLLEKARTLGVNLIQTGPNLPIEKFSERELETLVDKAQMLGITFEVGTRGLEEDHLVRQVLMCKRMGARLLRTLPEINGKILPTKEISQHLYKIKPLLEQENILLGIENYNIPAEEMCSLLESIASPYFGIVLDMVNSLAVPQGWKEVTRILAPYVMCLHYKDFIIRRVWHMMGFVCEGAPAGKGQLEIEWLLEALKPSPYDFNVILELWPPEQSTLDETIALEQRWAEESIHFLRSYVPD